MPLRTRLRLRKQLRFFTAFLCPQSIFLHYFILYYKAYRSGCQQNRSFWRPPNNGDFLQHCRRKKRKRRNIPQNSVANRNSAKYPKRIEGDFSLYRNIFSVFNIPKSHNRKVYSDKRCANGKKSVIAQSLIKFKVEQRTKRS